MRYGRFPISNNILELIPEAQKVLNNHPQVIFAYLFGGLAKRHLSSLSDVDIAVYLIVNKNELEIKMNLLNQLSNALKPMKLIWLF